MSTEISILDELGITTDPCIAYEAHKEAQKVKVAKPKSEYEEQKRLLKWASENLKKMPELAWLFHIPNGAGLVRNADGFSPEANRLKAAGMKRGVPDLFLPIRTQEGAGLWIEMKKVKSGRASKEQLVWIEQLRRQGFRCEVCHGWQQARDLIKSYLGASH